MCGCLKAPSAPFRPTTFHQQVLYIQRVGSPPANTQQATQTAHLVSQPSPRAQRGGPCEGGAHPQHQVEGGAGRLSEYEMHVRPDRSPAA